MGAKRKAAKQQNSKGNYNNVVDNFRVSVKIDFISLFRNVIKPEEIDKVILEA